MEFVNLRLVGSQIRVHLLFVRLIELDLRVFYNLLGT